jgi:KUP system potassium uptake protein
MKSDGGELVGYSDADWAGDVDDRHSTTGNLFLMAGGPVSWLSKKQPVVALSTSEAEYVALSMATQKAVWLRRFLSGLAPAEVAKPTVIMEDNQGTIAIARNPVAHARTKRIDIRYHYIHEAVQEGTVVLQYCPTEAMTADVLTKSLTKNPFETLQKEMGLSTC